MVTGGFSFFDSVLIIFIPQINPVRTPNFEVSCLISIGLIHQARVVVVNVYLKISFIFFSVKDSTNRY